MMRVRQIAVALLFALAFTASGWAAPCPLDATQPSITICQPTDGATVSSPARIVAAANSASSVTAIKVYVDGVAAYSASNVSEIDTSVAMSAGTRRVTVQAWNSAGAVFKKTIHVTVSGSGAPACTMSTTDPSVTICTPADGATVTSPVRVVAGTTSTSPVKTTKVYVDGTAAYSTAGGQVDTSLTMANGTHRVTVKAWNDAGAVFSKSITVNVSGGGTVKPALCTLKTADRTVTICTPREGETVPLEFAVKAGTTSSLPVQAIKIYIDGVYVYTTKFDYVDTQLIVSAGPHRMTVKAWDSSGTSFSSTVNFTASGGSTSGCAPATNGVRICEPAEGASVASPFRVFAGAKSSDPIASMTAYLDGTQVHTTQGNTLDTRIAAGAGAHRLTVDAVDSRGITYTSSANFTVPAVAGVQVTPRRMPLTSSQTQQFTASTAVTWAVDGIVGGNSTVGTITAGGLYTPPQAEGSHVITATSTADATQKGTATVWVTNHPGVFTYHNNNARTGLNDREIALSPANVSTSTFGKLFSYAVDGDIYGQPLYVANVSIPGIGTRNVVYVATQHGSIYAFDADGRSRAPLWVRTFIDPANNITPVPVSEADGTSCCFSEIAFTSTPVIDPATRTLYAAGKLSENGRIVYRLHALDMTTGQPRANSGLEIRASIRGSGYDNVGGLVTFNPVRQAQRPGLLLHNGVIYVAFGSHHIIDPWHGWLMGYDASTLEQLYVFNTTPDARKGGIWQGAGGPAADDQGNIYVGTGQGTFDAHVGGRNYGDTFLKLRPSMGSMAVLDFFTPHNFQFLEQYDRDLGSGGVMVLPPLPDAAVPNLLLGTGKEGNIFLVNRDNMGRYNSGNDGHAVQKLPYALAQHRGMPAYWNRNLYFAAASDVMKQFRFQNGLLTTSPVAQSAATFGYPGSTPSISANGNSNGIVWSLHHSGGPAVLYAFDASNISKLLYSSAQLPTRDSAGPSVRFAVPTVVNGRVYVGGKKQLTVYGLLP